MCVSRYTKVRQGDIWQTKNGTIIEVVTESWGGSLRCKVIANQTKEFPVGYQFSYQNHMGHVECGGNAPSQQSHCKLHPLDAVHSLDTPHAVAKAMAKKIVGYQNYGHEQFEAKDAALAAEQARAASLEQTIKEMGEQYAAETARMQAQIAELQAANAALRLDERSRAAELRAKKDEVKTT